MSNLKIVTLVRAEIRFDVDGKEYTIISDGRLIWLHDMIAGRLIYQGLAPDGTYGADYCGWALAVISGL